MRKNLFSLAIIASALTLTAHADTIDDFTLTGDSHTITYSLPSTVDFPNFSLFNFFSQSAPTTIDGVSSDETGLYYDTSIFPRVSLILSVPDAVFGDPSLYLLGPSFIDFDFFSPSEGAATFVPGTYTLQSLVHSDHYPGDDAFRTRTLQPLSACHRSIWPRWPL